MSYEVNLPKAGNLQTHAIEAKASKRPLLLVFTQESCTFCHEVKREVLIPMLLNADDMKRIILLEVSIDDGEYLKDFSGKEQSAWAFFSSYGLAVTPTAIILDGEGRIIADKIVGVSNIEFYSWYLDLAIEEARSKFNIKT